MTDEEHFKHNFAPKLAKIDNICDSWSNRNMSLKGKITVINALVTSILQYPCACSPSPPRLTVNFKRKVTDFIWNFKPSRIAYTLLIQPITTGGLKLADLESRIFACHVKWINFLWYNPDSILANICLQATKQHDMRTVILAKTDWSKKMNPVYSFLSQIFHTWAKFHVAEPSTTHSVLNEVIWNNDFLKLEERFQMCSKWKQAGIKTVKDLLHSSESRFLTHEELNLQYGLNSTFIEVLQIRAILPCKWKRLITTSTINDAPLPTMELADKSQVNTHDASSKRLYSYFIEYKVTKVSSQLKWETVFHTPQQERDEFWNKGYSLPFKTVRETKIQAFQYKVLHRLLPCNKYLKIIKVKEEDTCISCPEVDTLEHFLFLCPRVQAFWKGITQWLAREADLHFNITTEEYLFGFQQKSPHTIVINTITLYAKFYTYKQNLYHNGELSVLNFLRELRTKLHMESFLCQLESKQAKFKRWRKIYKALG